MGASFRLPARLSLPWTAGDAASGPSHGTAWVEVAGDAAALRRAESAWEDLARNALEPNPLYEPWMLLPALQSRPSPDFRCALVWTASHERDPAPQLAGVFPFRVVNRFKGLPATALVSWRHSSWLLGTPLVRREGARDCVKALLDWSRADRRGAPLVELQYIPADGPFHGVLADALRERDAMVVATETFTRALLRQGSESGIETALSSEWRKGSRRKERRLIERGAVAHVALRPGDDVHRWIEDFLQLEASGWKGRRRSALASSAEDRRFATEILANAFERGRLQILGVDFDGRPIARCCNLTAGEGAYAFRCAYDEAFARFSPGIMAELDSMREFHRLPRLAWMDSLTEPDNATLNRLWKGRRTMQTLVIGVGGWGGLWSALLPLLRWAKRSCHKVRAVALQ